VKWATKKKGKSDAHLEDTVIHDTEYLEVVRADDLVRDLLACHLEAENAPLHQLRFRTRQLVVGFRETGSRRTILTARASVVRIVLARGATDAGGTLRPPSPRELEKGDESRVGAGKLELTRLKGETLTDAEHLEEGDVLRLVRLARVDFGGRKETRLGLDEHEAVLVKDGSREDDAVAGEALTEDALLTDESEDEEENATDGRDNADEGD
jgi:hypothetical protein